MQGIKYDWNCLYNFNARRQSKFLLLRNNIYNRHYFQHIPQLIEFIEDAGQEVSPELRDLVRMSSRGHGRSNQSRGRNSYRY